VTRELLLGAGTFTTGLDGALHPQSRRNLRPRNYIRSHLNNKFGGSRKTARVAPVSLCCATRSCAVWNQEEPVGMHMQTENEHITQQHETTRLQSSRISSPEVVPFYKQTHWGLQTNTTRVTMAMCSRRTACISIQKDPTSENKKLCICWCR
jgi:hypothetical protein